MEQLSVNIAARTYPAALPSAVGKNFIDLVPADFEQREFGEDYDFTFVLRFPTIGEERNIEGMVDREFRKANFPDSRSQIGTLAYDVEYAIALVATLASKDADLPAWFGHNARSTTLNRYAIAEVGRAFREMADLKKKNT